jgi:hypothetical protein
LDSHQLAAQQKRYAHEWSLCNNILCNTWFNSMETKGLIMEKEIKLLRTKLLAMVAGVITAYLVASGRIAPEQVDPLYELIVGGGIFALSVFGYHKYQGLVDVEKEKNKL